ncbi:uncharacterized protein G2W53_026738 [Senna tora]|uniref:Uncharacterized protein n=1 Tax=Senna tora TaxID=362788 RepID=A0A834WHQ3_9FABA|nr:uncharacterized protein G2W53_026738 [Senna tora]
MLAFVGDVHRSAAWMVFFGDHHSSSAEDSSPAAVSTTLSSNLTILEYKKAQRIRTTKLELMFKE